MAGLQALESVQFVSIQNRRFAVLSADAWDALVDWLETLEDAQVAKSAIEGLREAAGDRARAGLLRWDAVSDQIA